jgi:hypothetical protein
MSKRGWIIVSVAAVAVAGLAGTTAGTMAYVHHTRTRIPGRAAARTARDAFDPYYGLVQYLRSVDKQEPELDIDPEDSEEGA